MSALETRASSQFIKAMGPMISDSQTMKQVIAYITLLRSHKEPCQYTSGEMHQVLADSVASVRAGRGTSHADLKKEIAQWL